VATALVISVIFLAFHVRVLPFAETVDNWLQGVALVALCIVYFSGLIIKALGPEAGAAYDPVLQVSSLVVIVLLAVVPVFLKAKLWHSGHAKKLRPVQLQGAVDSGVDSRNSELAGTLLLLPDGLLTREDEADDGYALMNDTDSSNTTNILVQQLQADLIATQERLQHAIVAGAAMRQEQTAERAATQQERAAERAATQQERAAERAATQEERTAERAAVEDLKEQLRLLREQ
jgi:hypothetical protein